MANDGPDDGGTNEGESVHSTILTGVDSDRLELDTVYDILSDRHRRYALYYLQDHDPVSADELAEQIATWEANTGGTDDVDETQERIAIELRHTHLPKLRDTGVIEYDRRSETIRHGTPPEILQTALDSAAEIEELKPTS